MKHYWVLKNDGHIYYLGEQMDFDAADKAADRVGGDTLWVIDEATAKEWKQALK